MGKTLLIVLPCCVGLAGGACQPDEVSTELPGAGARAGGSGAAARGGVLSGGTNGSAGRGSAGAPGHGGTGGSTVRGGNGPRAGGSTGSAAAGESGPGTENGSTSGGTAGGAGSGVAGQGASGVAGEASGAAGGEGGAGGESAEARVEVTYVSTFLGGLHAFSLAPESGAPIELTGSPVQEGAHYYDADVDSERRRLYAIDLDAKRIDLYRIADDGTLPADPNASKTVSFSPLMLALDPLGRFAYVAGSSDTAVHVLTIDEGTGELESLLDLHLEGAPAYVAPDPLGRFLYVTDAIEPGINAYAVGAGTFTKLEHSPFGKTLVRSGAMAFRPDGAFLFSTGNGLCAFSVDAESGALQAVEGSPFSLDVGTDFYATNVATDPTGHFLFATSAFLTRHLAGFAIDPASGALDEVTGSPLTVAGSPYSVAVSPLGGRVYTGNDDGTLSVFKVETDGQLKELDDSPFDGGGLQPELSFAEPR